MVSSGRSLVDKTRELAIEKGIDIHSAYLGPDDAIETVKEMESDGIEVVLARGGTAPLVRNHIQVPVLSFPLTLRWYWLMRKWDFNSNIKRSV